MNTRLVVVFLTLSLFASLHSINAQQILGVQFTLFATGSTQVTFVGGAVLQVTVTNAPAVLRLDEYLLASATPPANTQGWVFLVDAGFTFNVISGNVASVSLTTPSVSVAIVALLNSTFQIGCFQLSGSSYTRILFVFNSTTSTITIPLASTTSTYVFVTLNLQLPPINYNSSVQVVANSNQTYQWGSNGAAEFVIQFNSSTSNLITVTKYTTNTQAQAVFGKSLGVYFRIAATTSSGFNAIMQYTYTAAQLTAAGITDATKLQFAVYSTASASWVAPPVAGSVSTSAMIVYQPTNSFSDWAVTAATSGTQCLSYFISQVVYIVPFLSLLYNVL